MFDGPYSTESFVRNAAGVYAILSGSENRLLDVGESADIRDRVETHDRRPCWQRHATGTIRFAALYTPGIDVVGRRAIEVEIRVRYSPLAGSDDPPLRNLAYHQPRPEPVSPRGFEIDEGAMSEQSGYQQIRFVPTVKAYPALSRTYGEVSCIAGVRLRDGHPPSWVRLYPVPFRMLDNGRQFRKYEPMMVRVQTHSGDRRPESRRPDIDSIEPSGHVLGTDNAWRARRSVIEPLMIESMCALRREQHQIGTSLGVFRPKEVIELRIDALDERPDKELMATAAAAQRSLFDESEVKALEQIPFAFRYRYVCSDPGCRSHTQMIVDWELAQLYRRVRKRSDWKDRVRMKWLEEMCGEDKDTALMVGNLHQHPASFLVLGVWWPPRAPEQLALGESDDV